MRIGIDPRDGGTLELRDVFNSVVFKTDEGEELVVCMRDGAFEIAVLDTTIKPRVKGERYYRWFAASGSGISEQLNTGASESEGR